MLFFLSVALQHAAKLEYVNAQFSRMHVRIGARLGLEQGRKSDRCRHNHRPYAERILKVKATTAQPQVVGIAVGRHAVGGRKAVTCVRPDLEGEAERHLGVAVILLVRQHYGQPEGGIVHIVALRPRVKLRVDKAVSVLAYAVILLETLVNPRHLYGRSEAERAGLVERKGYRPRRKAKLERL